MIEQIFHREIDTDEGVIELVRAEGAAFVSVYAGPFVWQVELRDMTAVIRLLAHALDRPDSGASQIPLSDGTLLSIGRGVDRSHIWISGAIGHLRIRVDHSHTLLAGLSEARAHVSRACSTAGASC